MEEEEGKPAWMRWGGVVAGIVAAVLIALWLKDMLTPKGPLQKMKVQQITLVKPPPPPPPPEEKPPEPEIKEEVKIDQPEPTPDPQPAEEAAAPLNVGDGAEGGIDVGGSRGTPTLAGSGGGNPWGRYDALLNEAVSAAFQQALARDKALKGKNYKVVVKVWIDSGGKIERAALLDSTGDVHADEVLKQALNSMRALREAPPTDMPQPVKVRVTSRA